MHQVLSNLSLAIAAVRGYNALVLGGSDASEIKQSCDGISYMLEVLVCSGFSCKLISCNADNGLLYSEMKVPLHVANGVPGLSDLGFKEEDGYSVLRFL